MKWTPVLDALAMVGGEAKKEPLARAMAAGDVGFRCRTFQGRVIPGDPRMIVSVGKTKLGDQPPHKICWRDGTLDRFLVLTPEWAAPEPPLAIEIDVASLIEAFGPLEAPAEPPAPTARGRKPLGESRAPEIRRAFETMIAAGKVDSGRGGLRSAATDLMRKFRYELNSVEKIIAPKYREYKSNLASKLKTEKSETDLSYLTRVGRM